MTPPEFVLKLPDDFSFSFFFSFLTKTSSGSISSVFPIVFDSFVNETVPLIIPVKASSSAEPGEGRGRKGKNFAPTPQPHCQGGYFGSGAGASLGERGSSLGRDGTLGSQRPEPSPWPRLHFPPSLSRFCSSSCCVGGLG